MVKIKEKKIYEIITNEEIFEIEYKPKIKAIGKLITQKYKGRMYCLPGYPKKHKNSKLYKITSPVGMPKYKKGK